MISSVTDHIILAFGQQEEEKVNNLYAAMLGKIPV